MLLSGLWNVLRAISWITSLLWAGGFGLIWAVPLILGVVQAVLAVAFLYVGFHRGLVAGPVIGAIASVCNLHLVGLALDAVSFAVAMIASAANARSNDPAPTTP